MRKLIIDAEIAQPVRNNFDAIRLAMAYLVIWSHSFAIHLGTEQPEWVSLLLGGTYNAGNIGVMGFFIISGFLITQSYVRSGSVPSYFEKRVRRIYPGYMVATTITAFFFLRFIAPHSHPGIFQFAKAFGMNLLLRNYSPAPDSFGNYDGGLSAINAAMWSIPFEFWCYVGVAILGSMMLLTRRWLLAFLLLSVMALHVGLDALGKKPGLGFIGVIFGWPYLWTRMLPCFLLGMLAYVFKDRLPRSRLLLLGLAAATIVGCRVDQDVGYLITLPSLAYALFYVAFADHLPLHDAARFGDFSYGVYLYGFLIQKVLQFTIAPGWNTAEFFIASGALSLLAGVMSWHLVEKRFVPYRARKGRQRSARKDPLLNLAPRMPSSG